MRLTGVSQLALIVCAVAAVRATPAGDARANVIVYPAIPGLQASDRYAVTVDGREIWTEKFLTHMDIGKMPDWFLEPYTSVQQEVHQASFSCAGEVRIAVRVPGAIRSASVHPSSRGIRGHIHGNVLTFSLPGPGKIYVEIDSLPPLCIFADPLERDTVSRHDPHVHYFGPGNHHPGYITLRDSETVYIAAGAVVYGGIRATGVHDIRVIGRGVLDGGFEFNQMVLVEKCRDVLFEGVTIRNGDGWTNTLVNSERVRY